jgi:hypothetical protein
MTQHSEENCADHANEQGDDEAVDQVNQAGEETNAETCTRDG